MKLKEWRGVTTNTHLSAFTLMMARFWRRLLTLPPPIICVLMASHQTTISIESY
jgi:hypothetical protein